MKILMARSKYDSGDLSKSIMNLFHSYRMVNIYYAPTSLQMHVTKVHELSKREESPNERYETWLDYQ